MKTRKKTRGAAKRRARKAASRFGTISAQAPARKRRANKGRFTMKRKRSKSRGSTSHGFAGGLVSRETLAAVGGASLAAFAGPIVAGYLPTKLGETAAGRLAGSALIGGLGYIALRKVNRTAALAFIGAALAPAIAGEIGRAAAPKRAGVSGYGDGPAGVSYLPEGISGTDTLDDDLGELDDDLGDMDSEQIRGMGAYSDDVLEL